MAWVIALGCLITNAWASDACSLFMQRSDWSRGCRRRLRASLVEVSSSGDWNAAGMWTHPLLSPTALSACLKNKTIFFAGDSHLRMVVLGLIENLTSTVQDLYIDSRDNKLSGCGGRDGFDIKECGWPRSKRWVLNASGNLTEEIKILRPVDVMSAPRLQDEEWWTVFQFKTFVSTPLVDASIMEQLRVYSADLLVLETGPWGWVPYDGLNYSAQATRFLQTVLRGFKGPVVWLLDGQQDNMDELRAVLARFPDVLVFDRTRSIVRGLLWQLPSYHVHGYAGPIATTHGLQLLTWACTYEAHSYSRSI